MRGGGGLHVCLLRLAGVRGRRPDRRRDRRGPARQPHDRHPRRVRCHLRQPADDPRAAQAWLLREPQACRAADARERHRRRLSSPKRPHNDPLRPRSAGAGPDQGRLLTGRAEPPLLRGHHVHPYGRGMALPRISDGPRQPCPPRVGDRRPHAHRARHGGTRACCRSPGIARRSHLPFRQGQPIHVGRVPGSG